MIGLIFFIAIGIGVIALATVMKVKNKLSNTIFIPAIIGGIAVVVAGIVSLAKHAY